MAQSVGVEWCERFMRPNGKCFWNVSIGCCAFFTPKSPEGDFGQVVIYWVWRFLTANYCLLLLGRCPKPNSLFFVSSSRKDSSFSNRWKQRKIKSNRTLGRAFWRPLRFSPVGEVGELTAPAINSSSWTCFRIFQRVALPVRLSYRLNIYKSCFLVQVSIINYLSAVRSLLSGDQTIWISDRLNIYKSWF